MELPLVLCKDVDEDSIKNWNSYYKDIKYDWNRKVDEGLWRRTQEFNTRRQSGWKNLDSKRRRMVHYMHHYNLIDGENGSKDLALVDTYLWIHLCFPDVEIDEYSIDIKEGLKAGNWVKDKEYSDDLGTHEVYTKGSLEYKLSYIDKHPEDVRCGREFPSEYRILEILVTSKDYEVAEDIRTKPWNVFNRGQRRKDFRGNPNVVENFKDIMKYLPAQVELGCGPSIEAGIPPLNFLHDVYYVTNKENHKFILGSKEDRLAYNVARNTEETYDLFTKMYKLCFFAKPTKFYKTLKLLHDKYLVVGPIITNNFDGLPLKLGLKEKYVRRYEEQHIVPHIDFQPEAKSLVVIGSHADRRKIHASARNNGMKVIYIDPEGYYEDGNFIPYKLEDPQDGDILIKETSLNFCEKVIVKLLKEEIIKKEEVNLL